MATNRSMNTKVGEAGVEHLKYRALMARMDRIARLVTRKLNIRGQLSTFVQRTILEFVNEYGDGVDEVDSAVLYMRCRDRAKDWMSANDARTRKHERAAQEQDLVVDTRGRIEAAQDLVVVELALQRYSAAPGSPAEQARRQEAVTAFRCVIFEGAAASDVAVTMGRNVKTVRTHTANVLRYLRKRLPELSTDD